MPYNNTAIPPRKEATGQTQLPLSRVKKIIAQDQDIHMCSNNAAFIITLATEMFIQHLAAEGLNTAKLERKPRRNIQYKDLAGAVARHPNLEFLEDVVPKTVPFRQAKAHALAVRAQLNGGGGGSGTTGAAAPPPPAVVVEGAPEAGSAAAAAARRPPGAKKHKPSGTATRSGLNGAGGGGGGGGGGGPGSFVGASGARIVSDDESPADPADQLRSEMRQARGGAGIGGGGGGDVHMTG
ncbi:hypothetical protein GGS23DRAFT_119159 [Durotheca rogersii]|uniref:uncharacterized protein n=1 Tax=Durotheca rogersii TaxID=419775 RepID=UPI00221F0D99|nr:uncharacterized protein GGS23DRAFT_119159 [Durotheca rogersii]KAI5861924.1 hypothetical protein GGS23DRAFT_119159 [Durotheca rogersii]